MRDLETLREYASETLVILSDVKLPDGLDLLPRYKAFAPTTGATCARSRTC